MFTRNLLIGAVGALAVAAWGGAASAQASSTQTTTGSATVFQPIVLGKTSDLSFGTLVRPASGNGTVTIAAADGTRTLTGAGALLSTGPNAAAARAAYTVTGEGGQTFSITVPANFNMTRVSGSEIIQVTLASTATTATLNSVLGSPTAGTASFGVGGSIPITNGTAGGAYTGTFSVTVAYN